MIFLKIPELFKIFLLATVITFTSCTSSKKVIYFNNIESADSIQLAKAQNNFETPIQKNDQLWISIGGSNPQDLLAINSANGLAGTGGANIGSSGGTGAILGYTVEGDGKIQIPYVGRVQAEGLTRLQLEAQLTDTYKEYTKNPIVNVRFINYTVNVMGEVNRPGRISMTNERMTILEALTQAGDITYLGKSDNVLIVREQNGQRSFGRINLLSSEIFNSPFFYLKTNDVIYVEPVKAKFISRKGVPQYISIVAVGLSLVLTIVNITR